MTSKKIRSIKPTANRVVSGCVIKIGKGTRRTRRARVSFPMTAEMSGELADMTLRQIARILAKQQNIKNGEIKLSGLVFYTAERDD